MRSAILWIAQGFGTGRVPIGPGTVGSVLGIGWCALLLAAQSFWLFGAGILVGLAVSVWICGLAEELMQQSDPSSVVFDEIAAVPLCFLGWFWIEQSRSGAWPSPAFLLDHWLGVFGIFIAFRFFDIAKPWPVRQSQHLRGGWGVTADDVLAAVYVNIVAALWLMIVRPSA